MNKKISIIALFVTCICAQSTWARSMEGNEGGHGGDPYALEFTTLANGIAKSAQKYQSDYAALFSKYNFTAARFAENIDGVRVVSAEGSEVILDKHEVDAINYPAKSEIMLNRTRWREADLHSRVQLVLHEYFGIMNIERDSFEASINFTKFVSDATHDILAQNPNDAFMANLFYGRCVSVPALVDKSTCGDDPVRLAQAQSCAQTQAEGKCRISGKSQCKIMSTALTPTISTTILGLRYCEALVIMK